MLDLISERALCLLTGRADVPVLHVRETILFPAGKKIRARHLMIIAQRTFLEKTGARTGQKTGARRSFSHARAFLPHKAKRVFQIFYSLFRQAAEEAAGSPRTWTTETANHRYDRASLRRKLLG